MLPSKMFLVKYFIIFPLTIYIVRTELEKQLIHKFFLYKNTNLATIFHCSEKRDIIELAKYYSANNIRVSFFKITQDKYQISDILQRDYYRLSVVIDADCKFAQLFLEECGELKLYTEVYHWLILVGLGNVIFEKSNEHFYDSNRYAYDSNKYSYDAKEYSYDSKNYQSVDIIEYYFKDVNLNINSDVTMAIETFELFWLLFDVYNQALRHNGQLKYKAIGNYSEDIGFLVDLQDNKYLRRRNMTGVSFKSAIVVNR